MVGRIRKSVLDMPAVPVQFHAKVPDGFTPPLRPHETRHLPHPAGPRSDRWPCRRGPSPTTRVALCPAAACPGRSKPCPAANPGSSASPSGAAPSPTPASTSAPKCSLAIVAEPNEAGNVEGYYESVTAGFVAGS